MTCFKTFVKKQKSAKLRIGVYKTVKDSNEPRIGGSVG